MTRIVVFGYGPVGRETATLLSARVDASKFRARFGQEATSFEDGLAATIRFYRDAARASAGKASR